MSKSGGCSCGSGCCGPTVIELEDKRTLVIDFLYLDLSVCTRCQGTDATLDEAINQVSTVLAAAGVDIVVNKINVDTEEKAVAHEFVSSPTIRIDGRDIQLDAKESLCESCGDLCGDDVDCRVWVYQGQEYTTPPKAMIVDAILRAVYGGVPATEEPTLPYQLPENLKSYYAAMRAKDTK